MGTNKSVSVVETTTGKEYAETQGFYNINFTDLDGRSIRIGGIPLAYEELAKGEEFSDLNDLIDALRINPNLEITLKGVFNDFKAGKKRARLVA